MRPVAVSTPKLQWSIPVPLDFFSSVSKYVFLSLSIERRSVMSVSIVRLGYKTSSFSTVSLSGATDSVNDTERKFLKGDGLLLALTNSTTPAVTAYISCVGRPA